MEEMKIKETNGLADGGESTDPEESLDPANWDELRQLGHRMVDDMMDYLSTIREAPAWRKMPEPVLQKLQSEALPQEPRDARDVYEDFREEVLPYNKGNVHPRFWSWVEGGGTPFGMMADMLASGMNANLAIGNHAPVYVERQVLDWSKEIFGFPKSAGGILTSGASVANITALIAARNRLNDRIKQGGLRVVGGQMKVYGSAETHNCVLKGVEVIGIGSEHFRRVPVDENFRVRVDVMREMIQEDRRQGHLPFCIVGNAGTVNTGAIDDLAALAELAREQGVWFHIDGAFGAIPKLLPEFRERLKGLDEADSLSFDFHKWFYMNYEVGCVLIRDGDVHRGAFSSPVNYLAHHERGLSGGPDPFSNYGMELSRGFKALKVWMLLKQHGIQKYARLVRKNLEQAEYLGMRVRASRDLELMAEVSLNIVCYRYNPGGMEDEQLNRLNKEILMRLHEEGIATPSYTLLHGRYALRAAITNHRSRLTDFDALIEGTLRIGKEIRGKG
jgi:glutamate/tyrosine decarboxylase-like PLP-dependent enzyme